MNLSIVYDIVIAAILVVALILGARKGLLKSLLSVLIFLLSLVGASWIANKATPAVTAWVQPQVQEKLMETLTSGGSNNASVDLEALSRLTERFVEQARQAGQSLLEATVTGVLQTIVYALLLLLSFLVLSLLLRLITRPLFLIHRVPLLSGLNAFGGAILGGAAGVVIIYVAVWVLQRADIVDSDTIAGSYILEWFASHSLVDLFTTIFQ